MKNKSRFPPPAKTLSSLKEMFTENCLNEPQGTDFKRAIINFNKEFREFKEYSKKQLGELKEKQQELEVNKYSNDTQQNTKSKLMEIMKTIQHLRMNSIRRQGH